MLKSCPRFCYAAERRPISSLASAGPALCGFSAARKELPMPTALTIISEKGNSVQTIGPEATILEATRKMNQHRIGALVVMSGNSVAGIFTERDVLQRVVGAELNPAVVTVGEVMTR